MTSSSLGRPPIPLPPEFESWRRTGLGSTEISLLAGVSVRTASRWVSGEAGVFRVRIVFSEEERLAHRRATERARYVPKPPAPRLTGEEKRARRLARNSRPEVKARRAALVLARYHADPAERLRVRMSKAVRRALSASKKQRRPWTELVGYSVEELRVHLERQFLPGMNWANIELWQVDHVLPVAGFGPMSPGDDAFRACWALTNLRPLWKIDNLLKGSKREHLL